MTIPAFHVVLDTDIGTDVDDALALAVLLGADVDLRLVTCTYGDTLLRARMAKRMCEIAGRTKQHECIRMNV